MRKEQFLTVVAAEKTRRRGDAAIDPLARLGQWVPLAEALGRGLADDVASTRNVAPLRLLDRTTGPYDAPFVPPGARLIAGGQRGQGPCLRPGDRGFERPAIRAFVAALAESSVRDRLRTLGFGPS
jgi:putative molybdopterin biosynthesis protein